MIQLNKAQFDQYARGSPERLHSLIDPIFAHREELYRRYSRKSSPTEMMHGGKKIVPFEFYIVKMAQGYLAGKAPTYRVTGDKKGYAKTLTDEIERIRRYNDDGALYCDLMHDYLTVAAAYIYAYENDDNEIVYTRFDPRQTVAVYDFSTPANLIGVLRRWVEPSGESLESTVRVLEIITAEERKQWRRDEVTVVEPLNWGDVPVSAIEEPDGIAVFEPALQEIETYEQISTNLASMTQYNDQAKLLLVNYTIPEEPYTYNDKGEKVENTQRTAYENALLRARVLATGSDGDIRWLTKDVDYTGMLDAMKEKHDNITMLTGVPNMTDEAFSNAENASALGYKLYALDQYAASADRAFRKAYLRMWELICGRLNLRGASYDFRDIDIVLNRNVPTDRDKSIDRAVKMNNSGLFSAETCITESGVEVDPAEEIKKAAAEEEAEYELMMSRTGEIENEGQQRRFV